MKRKTKSNEIKVYLLIVFLGLLSFFLYKYVDLLSYKNQIENFYFNKINQYPLYLQILVLLSPFLLYILIGLIRKNRSKYREDEIYGILWKWDWSRHNISNLQCFCPKCKNELYYDINNANGNSAVIDKIDFICENCNKVVSSMPNSNNNPRPTVNVINEIERIVKKRLLKH